MGNAPGALHQQQQQHAQSTDRDETVVLSSVPIAQVYGAYGLPVDSGGAAAARTQPQSHPPQPVQMPLSMSLIDEEFEEAYANGRPLYRGEMQRDASPLSSLSSSPPQPSPPGPALPALSPSPSPCSALPPPVGALASVPLEVQLQFLRLLCTHLDFRSLLAAGRVNTQWRAALAPDAVVQAGESLLSPSGSSVKGSMESPASSDATAVESPLTSPAPPAAIAREEAEEEEEEEEEEEPRRRASAQPPSYAALHMNPFASPLGWGAPQPQAQAQPFQPLGAATTGPNGAIFSPFSPADSAGDSSSDSAAAAATTAAGQESGSSDEEEEEEDDEDGDDALPIRFHMEPAPVPRGFGSHLSRLALLSPSPWHPSLELLVPARGAGWAAYAARSESLRSVQRVTLCVDAERIHCIGGSSGAWGAAAPNPASATNSNTSPFPARALSPEESLQLSQLNSSLHSCSPHELLPHLRSFPFLRALRCRLPLERHFRGDGRARLRDAFEKIALNLRELHWEVLPEQAGDAARAATTLPPPSRPPTGAAGSAAVAPLDPASHLSVLPPRPSGVAPSTALERETAQWSEQDRARSFCAALVDSLPLLSLTSLSLSHFTLPDAHDLSPLRLLPLLHSLHLWNLPVTRPRLLVVRSISTLRHLAWAGWGDEHAILFAANPPPALRSIAMAYASLGLLGLRALARSAIAPRLDSLRLDECAAVGDEACGLVASQFRSLRSLALRLDSPVAGFSGAALCSLVLLPALTHLELVGAGIPLRHCLPQFCSTLRAAMDADEPGDGNGSGHGEGDLDGSSVAARGLRTLILEQVQLVPSAMELASLAAAAASDNPDSPVSRAFSAASSSASHSASAFKHLTQLRTLTALAVRRCGGTNNLLAYVSLLPQLRRLELERRRTPPAPVAKPASPPAAALLGATSCTRGAQGDETGEEGGRSGSGSSSSSRHSWSSAAAQSQQTNSKAPSAAAPPSSPFGSLLLLSSLPRLEHLSCNFAQPRGPPHAGALGQGSHAHAPPCSDGVLDQLHQLRAAFLSRGGRRVYCEWRGQHVQAPVGNGGGEEPQRRSSSPEDDGFAFA